MFKQRIRLPFYLSKAQFPTERNVFRKADGSTQVLSAIIRMTYEGRTDQMPELWHRRLVIALNHDEVTIEDYRLLTDVTMDGEYEIDWQDFLDYPVAQSNFKVNVTPFNATNSNCKTCEEVIQLDLVDDYPPLNYAEGTTNTLPTVLSNDNICCYPYTVAITDSNADYFEAVSIDQAGVITFTVKNPAPNITGQLLLTYSVTCQDGAYDTADVYVNISGTSTECVPPSGLNFTPDPLDYTGVKYYWTIPIPAPAGGFEYALYLLPEVITPVATGTLANTIDNIDFTGLANGKYLFTIKSLCGGSESILVNNNAFSVTDVPFENCGKFKVTYLPTKQQSPQIYGYMDCAGNIRFTAFVGAGSKTFCMLMNAGTQTPAFIGNNNSDITTSFVSLCVDPPAYLALANYTGNGGGITDTCTLASATFERTIDAQAEAAAAGEKVKVTYYIEADNGKSVYVDIIFQPADLSVSEVVVVNATGPACSVINLILPTAIVVIP